MAIISYQIDVNDSTPAQVSPGDAAGNHYKLLLTPSLDVVVGGSVFGGADTPADWPQVAASGSLTSDTVNPAPGDTVTIGSLTYTLVAALTGGGTVAGQVKIGVDAATTLLNLTAAINGDVGAATIYGADTPANPDARVSEGDSTHINVVARIPGPAGNDLGTSASSAHLSWDAGNLAGGAPAGEFDAIGFPVASGGVLQLDLAPGEEVWVRAASGSGNVRVMAQGNLPATADLNFTSI